MSSNHPSSHVKWVTEVTVWVWRRTGHASQTTVVYPHTGSTTYVREMSTPPIHSTGVWPSFTFTWPPESELAVAFSEVKSADSHQFVTVKHTHTVHTYCVLFVCVWTQIASSKYTLFLLPLVFLLFLLFDGVIFFLRRNE